MVCLCVAQQRCSFADCIRRSCHVYFLFLTHSRFSLTYSPCSLRTTSILYPYACVIAEAVPTTINTPDSTASSHVHLSHCSHCYSLVADVATGHGPYPSF